jgi:hypothetical protein
MRSLSSLKSSYAAIAKRLHAPPEFIRFAETPQHDGSPHIESNGNTFAYVITERGEEYERNTTMNEDDILYWLVRDLTREMASRFELAHRKPNVDSRRLSFQKHLELLGTIDQRWETRLHAEYETILTQHPFRDTMDEQRVADEALDKPC